MTDKRLLGLCMGFRLAPLICALGLGACATAPLGPSAPSQRQAMVSSADPRASQAGLDILAAGGSAADAAIATMLVLGLVEPQSAGLGGGAFALTYDAETDAIGAYNGRETAPAGASADMFLESSGQPASFQEAVLSGRSVGAPGLMPALKLLHEDHGRLDWARLFEPAIRLAEEGFEISPRLHHWISFADQRGGRLRDAPAVRDYFFTPEGDPLPAGTVRTNPAYAATLRALAREGPAALSTGSIAEAIVAAAQAEPNGGTLTLEDLASYQALRADPICGRFRVYLVCGMGPPSSGGVAVLSILGLYERARPHPEGPQSVEDWAAFLWASRIAYADRDHYVGDDAFVPVPTLGLFAPAYLDARAGEIDLAAAPGAVQPGDPSLYTGGPSLLDRWGRDRTEETPGTTHLSVVDFTGDAVSLTATVESVFGSQRWAAGFFLNNQLTDFSLAPTRFGGPVANAVAPGKRPRSSMAPTVILNEAGELVAVIGSPGGSAIISYVARTIIGFLDWDLTMQEAIEQPIMVAARPGAVRAELDRLAPEVAAALQARGWTLQPTTFETSGLHGIRTGENGLEGGADPRREGAVARLTQPAE